MSILLLFTFVPLAIAHGIVTSILSHNISYPGYFASYQYLPNPPQTPSWSIPLDTSTGFIPPTSYGSPDIICHLNATPPSTSLLVRAGDTISLQWTKWPEGHHGPVIDYLAPCNGNCSLVPKTELNFSKIAATGLINSTRNGPGFWASDLLIAANNTWNVTVPLGLKKGEYVLRHEIIALHAAGQQGGAQNYPQCVSLQVTGDGGIELADGILGTGLYKVDDRGIKVDIYKSLGAYEVPGPTMWSGMVVATQGTSDATGSITLLSQDGSKLATTSLEDIGSGTVQTSSASLTSYTTLSSPVLSDTTPSPTITSFTTETQTTGPPLTTESDASITASASEGSGTMKELVAWLDVIVAALAVDKDGDGDMVERREGGRSDWL